MLLRYGTVGVLNTLLTLATFTALTASGVDASVASALGFGVGAINGYVWNRRWTFRCAGGFWRYVGVQLLGAACSAAGIALLSAPHLLAECIVIPCVTLLTYTLSRTIVFSSTMSGIGSRAPVSNS